jgi:hypothetical protein
MFFLSYFQFKTIVVNIKMASNTEDKLSKDSVALTDNEIYAFVPAELDLVDETSTRINEDSKQDHHSKEDDSDYESESSNDCNLNCILDKISGFSFTVNSELYVVCLNGTPKFYVNSEKLAEQKMWDVAQKISSKMSDYHINYMEISEKELHLTGSYKFFFVRYEKTLHKITYSVVKECV